MATNGSIATTLSPTRDTLTSSQLLSSSISSLSNSTSSSRHGSSQISKIYKQASTLFLTRRLPESLSTILPVITPPEDTGAGIEKAPIAKASRTTRIKVWSLYLTILNAIAELDPDEGKEAFGSSDWRALVTKVRDGEVWEEVVKNGYGGVEGDVDSDVVINLATLLLAHARTQKINQTRLETYLAASTQPNLDISSRMQDHARSNKRNHTANGTDTPRDLNARVKILEIYTLHVLLKNNEWDYAREFISISAVLDEERREAFLQALQTLQDEHLEAERREKEERRYQEEQLKKDIEDARRRRLENEQRERKREEEEQLRRGGSEIDYGVEEPRPGTARSGKSNSARGSVKGPSSSRKQATSNHTPTPATNRKPPPTMLVRMTNLISNIRALILHNVVGGFRTRPMFLVQMLAFIIGILVVVSRKEVKTRIRNIMATSWGKVSGTVKMGGKVSYI
ncbi:hypothetical protein HYFRA_00013198 [Hymenoscyphus fraxineus]|uniref:Peroxin 26 n=1 Tax=Hymenoscyphus fraxineus TaxID=746836 RepID=A0A9N9L489_9HELO|nr:hypothetical protein HYFRA_00013198 [Hymenoscyphus fraxineus]